MKKLTGDPYANRERGDLSEYSSKMHGLSMLSGGRDMAVLRAWDRGDFTTVLDICDDIIAAYVDQHGEAPIPAKLLRVDALSVQNTTAPSSGDTARAHQATLYIFHRNVKAAALNYVKRYKDAIQVADETLRLTDRTNRDAYCLKGTALNALGSVDHDKAKDEYALECFQAALNLLSPGSFDLEASLNHATLLFKLGKMNEALEAAQTTVSKITLPIRDHTVPDFYGQSSEDPFADLDEPSELDDSPPAVAQAALDRDHIKYDPDLHALIAAIYMETNEIDKAIAACHDGIKALKRKGALESSLLTRFYEMQLQASIRARRVNEAELLAKMLMRLMPNNMKILGVYVQMMLELKRPYEQLWAVLQEQLTQVGHILEKKKHVLMLCIQVLQHFNLDTDAIKYCDVLLKLGPNPRAYVSKAVLLNKQSQHLAALHVCEEAETQGASDGDLLAVKGLILEQLDRHAEALQAYDYVITHYPQTGVAYLQKGNMLNRTGKPNEAAQVYDQGVRVSRNAALTVQLLVSKAAMLRGIGRLKEAIQAYTAAAKFDPDIAKMIPTLQEAMRRGNPAAFMSEQDLERQRQLQRQLSSRIGQGGPAL